MRLGLLAPYNGTNLGDGATMMAVLQNLRTLLPEAEFLAFTMDPVETTRLQGIPAARITGLEVDGYSDGIYALEARRRAAATRAPTQPDPSGGETRATAPWFTFRDRLKRRPAVRAAVRTALTPLRGLAVVLRELRDLPAAYRQASSLDVLFIAGGGQLHDAYGGPWGHPYTLLRWSVLARLAGARSAFVSIGTQTMQHWLSRVFCNLALRLADYRSYREAATHARLRAWKFTTDDPVVADPAFSIDLRQLVAAPYGDASASRIGISPIAYGHRDLWPNARHDVYERYIDALAGFSAWLLREGRQIVLYRSGGVDATAIADVRRALERLVDAEALARVHEPDVTTVQQFFAEVSTLDLVVSSRLHGVIMPHILGTPVLPVSFDPKVEWHVRDMHQEAYLLQIDTVTSEQLIERFVALSAAAARERATIRQRGDEFRGRLAAQYVHLASFVREAARART